MKKNKGEERRQQILQLLMSANRPYTGTELSKLMSVSRQVIVNDINLLKAKSEPILSTSQGYLYFQEQTPTKFERKIVCYHLPEDTIDELYTIVDCGVTINNVIIEHPVYGDITVSMHLTNRLEVDQFVQKINKTNAPLLSALTDGTHLHTISAHSENALQKALAALREKGYLVEN